MTPTTADKVKEIYFSIAKELTGDDWDFTADYERWLTTPEGSRLVGELVEGRKKDEPKKSWEELRDLFKSNTKIPAVDRSILHFECFLHGYEEGKKSST